MKNIYPKNGFALLYAVLLTGIILAIGLGLSAILAKQIILSSTGASSQVAYYAANTAKECIIHWGIYGQTDPDTDQILSPFGYFQVDIDTEETVYVEPNSDSIECGSETIDIPEPEGSGSEERYFDLDEFNIVINGVNTCAEVEVYVRSDELSEVIARGYNTACGDDNNPRKVERQISGKGSFLTLF